MSSAIPSFNHLDELARSISELEGELGLNQPLQPENIFKKQTVPPSAICEVPLNDLKTVAVEETDDVGTQYAPQTDDMGTQYEKYTETIVVSEPTEGEEDVVSLTQSHVASIEAEHPHLEGKLITITSPLSYLVKCPERVCEDIKVNLIGLKVTMKDLNAPRENGKKYVPVEQKYDGLPEGTIVEVGAGGRNGGSRFCFPIGRTAQETNIWYSEYLKLATTDAKEKQMNNTIRIQANTEAKNAGRTTGMNKSVKENKATVKIVRRNVDIADDVHEDVGFILSLRNSHADERHKRLNNRHSVRKERHERLLEQDRIRLERHARRIARRE